MLLNIGGEKIHNLYIFVLLMCSGFEHGINVLQRPRATLLKGPSGYIMPTGERNQLRLQVLYIRVRPSGCTLPSGVIG